MRDDFHLRARLSPAVSSIQAGAPLSDASSLFVIGRAGRHRRSVWSRPPENPSPPPQSPWVARTCSSWRSTPTTRCTTPSARAPRTRTARSAAASALGRDSVSVEAGHVRRAPRERVTRVLDEGETVGDGAAVLGAATHPTSRRVRPYDAAVVRIDLAALPGGATGATPASRHGHTPRLDAHSRQKTETRVAAGGTGGAALLESARRAARHLERAGPAAAAAARAAAPAEYLTKQRRDDDDGPVVVSAGDVAFGDDGWCVGERAANAAANAAEVTRRTREAAEADARMAAAENAARRLREAAKRTRLREELARRRALEGEEGGASNLRSDDKKRRRRRDAPRAAPVSFEVED